VIADHSKCYSNCDEHSGRINCQINCDCNNIPRLESLVIEEVCRYIVSIL